MPNSASTIRSTARGMPVNGCQSRPPAASAGIECRIAAQAFALAELQYPSPPGPPAWRGGQPRTHRRRCCRCRRTATLLRLRPATAQQIEGSAPGAFHQLGGPNRNSPIARRSEARTCSLVAQRARQLAGGGECSELHQHPGSLSVYLIYTMESQSTIDFMQLARKIKSWGRALGFQKVGITDTDLQDAERHLDRWLGKGFHGEMAFMQQHGSKRTPPLNWYPARAHHLGAWTTGPTRPTRQVFSTTRRGLLSSRYALGRDYRQAVTQTPAAARRPDRGGDRTRLSCFCRLPR